SGRATLSLIGHGLVTLSLYPCQEAATSDSIRIVPRAWEKKLLGSRVRETRGTRGTEERCKEERCTEKIASPCSGWHCPGVETGLARLCWHRHTRGGRRGKPRLCRDVILADQHLLALLGILEFLARRTRQRKLQHFVDGLHVVRR